MLSNHWLRLSSFATLALALAVGACDGHQDASSGIMEPLFELQGSEVQSAARKGEQHGPRKIKEGKDESGAKAKAKQSGRVIGSEGGTIEFRGHRLTVPAGAVEAPTLFRITQVEGGFIELELKATQRRKNGLQNDVGHLGFLSPITLELSYAAAEGVEDASRLAIGWVKDDGTIQVLPSVVDSAAQIVRARLDHFSKYAMVAN